MKLRLSLMMTAIIFLSSAPRAQEISRKDFRYSEWKMKRDFYEKLMERQSGRIALDQADFDVKYWDLQVDVTDIDNQIISGTVTMTSQPVVNGLGIAEYNFHQDMTVDQVSMGGSPVAYTHNSGILAITLDQTYNTGEQFTTTVTYHGHPPGGGFGSFTWSTHNGQPIISTLSEPEGAREWWPCKDMPHDKADSADVEITTPDNLVGTSNGLLVSNVDNGDGTRTFHWKISYPITTYLISLAVSNYQSFTDYYTPSGGGDPMPVVNYVYPEHYDNAVEDLSITPQAIGVFASLFGEYPFINEKYGHTIFPWGGAMEHQCNTSYGSSLIRGDHHYDWILVHELSHQWFGDMITCDIWPDIWMNEGFASYMEAIYVEQTQNFNAYRNYMLTMNAVYDPSGPIYDPSPLFDGNTVYSKGAWVLDMLRGVMGDQAFFDGMYGYANDPDHMYGTITTLQYRDIMAGYYGAALDWFFDEWVWGMNRPQYQYSWIDENIGGGQYDIFLHIDQIQGSPAPDVFTMPIKIYPTIGGSESELTVWNDTRSGDYRLTVDGDPTLLEFDKYDWILKTAAQVAYGLNIVTTDLPEAHVDQAYSATIEARGGTSPYSFSVVSGSLPPGLSLNGGTGEISGIPTSLGQFPFTVRCTDSSDPARVDDQDYSMTVSGGADIPTMSQWGMMLMGLLLLAAGTMGILRHRRKERPEMA